MGSTVGRGYVESFDARLRDELLDGVAPLRSIFSLNKAKTVIED